MNGFADQPERINSIRRIAEKSRTSARIDRKQRIYSVSWSNTRSDKGTQQGVY